IDLLATRLGQDPADVRRRNLIRPEALPYANPAGLVYDSGSFVQSLERVLEAADYPALRREQARLRRSGRRIGIGLSCYTEFTGMGTNVFKARGMDLIDGRESAHLVVESDGRVRL